MFGFPLRCAVGMVGSVVACVAHAQQPDTALARKVVFEVSVRYPGEQVGRFVQPGFLVGEDGVGITSYNALHGASRAEAVFADAAHPFEVVILRAKPSLDLALIRLVNAKDAGSPPADFLTMAPGDLRDRQPVWTLKSSVAFDETKAMPGIVTISSQNVGRNTAMAFDAPGWISGDINQDRRTSGCPLVDERGRLVGVSVWSWPGASRPAGLTARAVDELLAEYAEDVQKAQDKGQPAPTIAVKDAKQKYHDAKLIGSIFPRMAWPEGSGPRADSANARAKQLRSDLQCPACKGTGKGPESGSDKRRARRADCPACEGSKFQKGDVLARKVALSAAAITSVPPGTEAYETMLGNLAEGVEECSELNSAAFASRLNDVARTQLDPKRIKRGEAVMFTGALQSDRALAEWDKDVVIISPGWSDDTRILAVSHDDGGKLGRAQSAVFVGIVTGTVTAGRDKNYVVLERVSAVPLRSRTR